MADLDPKDAAALEAVKKKVSWAKARNSGIDWYPYDSLASLREAASLAAGAGMSLSGLMQGASVLDVGTGDGHGAFLAEELGAPHVCAVDWPATNYNQMKGVTELARALGSQAEIYARNMDGGVAFPGHQFNAGLALGLLYHLKNPYGFLESLRQCCWHLLLSTAVVMDRDRDEAVAYLVGEQEENADPTNFWLLTPGCLRRLLERTRWEVLAWREAPESAEGARRANARVFVLARAKSLDPIAGLLNVHGFHALEEERYRWTGRRFGFTVALPSGVRRCALAMQGHWPIVCQKRFGPLRGQIWMQGRLAARFDHDTSEAVWIRAEAELPEDAPPRLEVLVELEHALPPDEYDPRERGITVDTVRVDFSAAGG